MAGDWIKIEHVSVDKPEIDQLHQLTGLDHDSVFGKCVRLWIWADQQSLNGDALCVTKAFIDRHVFHEGFAKALLSVGWLDGRDGRYLIPNFDRHNGESAKKRALSKDRNSMKRKRDAASVTKASLEKRREEKSKERERGECENEIIPNELNTKEFRDTWKIYRSWWLSMTGTQLDDIKARFQIEDLHRRGHDKAIRDLKKTMQDARSPGTIWDSDRNDKRTNGKSTIEDENERRAKRIQDAIKGK